MNPIKNRISKVWKTIFEITKIFQEETYIKWNHAQRRILQERLDMTMFWELTIVSGSSHNHQQKLNCLNFLMNLETLKGCKIVFWKLMEVMHDVRITTTIDFNKTTNDQMVVSSVIDLIIFYNFNNQITWDEGFFRSQIWGCMNRGKFMSKLTWRISFMKNKRWWHMIIIIIDIIV